MNGEGFDRLEAHLAGSWLVGICTAFAERWRAAFGRSAMVVAIRDRRDRYRALPDETRLRGLAIFAGTAALGHVLLVRVVPAHLAPALPRLLWILVAATATLSALLAARLTAAWPSSIARRLLQRRVRPR